MSFKEAVTGFFVQCEGAYPVKYALTTKVGVSITIYKDGTRDVGCPFLNQTEKDCRVPLHGANIVTKKCVRLYPGITEAAQTVALKSQKSVKPDSMEVRGHDLKKLRKDRRLTQKNLAELAEISHAWVSVIEREDARVTRKTAEGLSRALGTDLESLIKSSYSIICTVTHSGV